MPEAQSRSQRRGRKEGSQRLKSQKKYIWMPPRAICTGRRGPAVFETVRMGPSALRPSAPLPAAGCSCAGETRPSTALGDATACPALPCPRPFPRCPCSAPTPRVSAVPGVLAEGLLEPLTGGGLLSPVLSQCSASASCCLEGGNTTTAGSCEDPAAPYPQGALRGMPHAQALLP